MVYKFMPVKAKNYYPGIGGVNAVKTKEIFSECRWGNLNSPGVLIDRESYRNIRLPRQNYLRAAEVFIDEKKPELAIEMLDECLDNFPSTKVLFDMYMLPFAELYYQAGGIEQANAIVREIKRVYADDMRYYFSLDSEFADTYYKNEIQRASSVLKRIVQISRQAKQEDVAAEVEATVNLYQL
jgi:tetratricopeptide (TPR) repeat protein